MTSSSASRSRTFYSPVLSAAHGSGNGCDHPQKALDDDVDDGRCRKPDNPAKCKSRKKSCQATFHSKYQQRY
jgi:hypothetical protein